MFNFLANSVPTNATTPLGGDQEQSPYIPTQSQYFIG